MFRLLITIVLLLNSNLFAETPLPQRDQYVAAVNSWHGKFRVTTNADITQLYKDLHDAIATVTKAISALPTAGDIRKDVKLDMLELALADKSINATLLDEVHYRLRSDRLLMEDRPFIYLRAVIRVLRARILSRDDLDAPKIYEEAIDKIADYYHQRMSGQGEVDDNEFRKSLEWLARYGQAKPLRESMEKLPNLVGQVSPTFFGKMISLELDKVIPLVKFQDGVHLRGSSVAHASGKAALHSHPNKAVINVDVTGTAKTTAVGSMDMEVWRWTLHGGSSVAGHTDISVSIPVEITDQMELKAGDLSIWTKTTTQPYNPTIWIEKQTRRRGKIHIERPFIEDKARDIILKQANQKKGEAEVAADQEMQGLIRKEITSQLPEPLQLANTMVHNVVITKLKKIDFFPKLNFSTQPTFLDLKAAFNNDQQFPAFTRPVPPQLAADVKVSAHESLINNFAVLLKGSKVKEDEVQKFLFGSLMHQPEEDVETGVILSTLEFSNSDPIKVEFLKNGTSFTINLTSVEYRRKLYPVAVRMTGNYDLVDGANGSQLVRQGDVDILPMNDFEIKPQLQATLEGIANRLLVPRATIIEPKYNFKFQGEEQALELKETYMTSGTDGWVHVGWNLHTTKKPIKQK